MVQSVPALMGCDTLKAVWSGLVLSGLQPEMALAETGVPRRMPSYRQARSIPPAAQYLTLTSALVELSGVEAGTPACL